MNEQKLEALYERSLLGDDTATEQIITTLIDPNDDIREAAAWTLMDLLAVDVLTAAQVQTLVKRLAQAELHPTTRAALSDSVERFNRRQPQPCPDCGRTDCRQRRLDVDDWVCSYDTEPIDEEDY